MKNIQKFTFIYFFVLVFCAASSAMAASFSADMETKKSGKTETMPFYLSDPYYRMEVIEDGKPMVIIADREKNVHRFLNMAEKVFFEIPSDDFRILSNDPFKASENMVAKYGSHAEGTEKINGIICEKQVVTAQGKKIHSRWYSDALKFPVKVVSYRGTQAAYVTELKTIKKVGLQMDLFAPPADFKQVEEPGAAEERKREKQRKAEEALPGLTAVGTTQVPCYVKIAGGGELRVQMDTDRKAYLEITNQAKGESKFTIVHYRNGKPTESHATKTRKLEGKGDRTSWTFNDDFAQKAGSFLVDELRIGLQKGVAYVELRQSGADRTDIYNRGGSQTDAGADPKRPLTLSITGDNPFGDQTIGKFWLRYQAGGSSEAIPFTLSTGKTRKWEYPAEKGIQSVTVIISKGDGRAKISLVQPPVPGKATPEQAAAKKAPKPKYSPKAKAVTQFTVTHPAGTSKPLTPGKDLAITVTGVSGTAKGNVELFSDSKKTKKIDQFRFTLKKNQVKSHFVSGDNHVVWARVWVSKGSFAVKLDQSPNAKPAPTPLKRAGAAKPAPKSVKRASDAKPAPTPKANPAAAAPHGMGQSRASSGLILNGEAPLMPGAKVIREKALGPIHQVELEMPASPEAVVNFYKQAMVAKGWQLALDMVQGPMGVLQLKKEGRQITLKALWDGQKSMVKMVVMAQ